MIVYDNVWIHHTISTVNETIEAKHALKLVGKSFPWRKSSTFAHSMDSHTSAYLGSENMQLYVDQRKCSANVAGSPFTEPLEISSTSLFSFPGVCNFSGARHNLNAIVIKLMLATGTTLQTRTHDGWLPPLNAAKHMATHRLDLPTVPFRFRNAFVLHNFRVSDRAWSVSDA
ncbi:hypothetical protein KXD40_000707 [Peronospora effusa]|uniref:Uncharacterized protein n=1 Tax=Peronospora effusa TaxID=542832 RepID=A0A3M6VRR4_9STRA|nr:hypothetical protein DD238_002251 [Peronospora effusa]RQM11934.1 hypothetical protein DD237_003093 [Peronospora effusa]UIZ21765.1 hypothetical protein KXD40_000707 [Peronospora effusa]